MATVGSQNCNNNFNLERVFDDAQHTGEIQLSNRKLKEYPKLSIKYDLIDTISTDLSRNRFSEIPSEVLDYLSLENLNCYQNVMRNLPLAIDQLQSLVYLNISRNQLSSIPPVLCHLRLLEVLHASNNRLQTLPEEIAQLENLMHLDVSCNELEYLPTQLGDLDALRNLDVHKNNLDVLPTELSRLQLHKLDVSSNKLTHIPCEFLLLQKTLQELNLHSNPLISPPANLCAKGRIHVMKYLYCESMKNVAKRGTMGEVELRRRQRKFSLTKGAEIDRLRSPSSERKKRNTFDSGYSTTDSSEKSRLSPSASEVSHDLEELQMLSLRSLDQVGMDQHFRHIQQTHHNQRPNHLPSTHPANMDLQHPFSHVHHPEPLTPTTPPGVVTPTPTDSISPISMGSNKQPHYDMNSAMSPVSSSSSASTPSFASCNSSMPSTPNVPVGLIPGQTQGASIPTPLRGKVSVDQGEDAFTRELQRQKAEYEAKKRIAENLRKVSEEEQQREKEQNRRATQQIQKEQKLILERERAKAQQRWNQRRPQHLTVNSYHSASIQHSGHSSNASSSSSNTSYSEHTVLQHTTNATQDFDERRLPHSQSFREESCSIPEGGQPFRRTNSECTYGQFQQQHDKSDQGFAQEVDVSQWKLGPDLDTSSDSIKSLPRHHQQNLLDRTNSNMSTDEEYKSRHEAMINHQRHEAEMMHQRLLEHKTTLKQDVEEEKRQIMYDYYMKNKQGSCSSSDSNSNYSGFARDGDSVPPPRTAGYTASNGSAVLRNHNTLNNGSTPTNNGPHGDALPTAVQRGLEEMSTDVNSMNPRFTMRRQLHQHQLQTEQLNEMRSLIESRLKLTLPDDLPGALRDGVVLCHLANNVRPRSVSSIHVPSPAVPKLTHAKCRRNVENFLEACRRIGVEQDCLCACDDILDEIRLARVARLVQNLSAIPPITNRDYQSAICPVSNIIEEKGLVALAATVKALVSFKPKTSAV